MDDNYAIEDMSYDDFNRFLESQMIAIEHIASADKPIPLPGKLFKTHQFRGGRQ